MTGKDPTKANNIRPGAPFTFRIFPITEADRLLPEEAGPARLLILREAAGCNPRTDDLLGNILKALKLDPETDCATVCLAEGGFPHLPTLARRAQAPATVIFGYAPTALGVRWQWPTYKVLTRDGRRYLFADKLDHINSDSNHKRSLWEGLQALMAE